MGLGEWEEFGCGESKVLRNLNTQGNLKKLIWAGLKKTLNYRWKNLNFLRSSDFEGRQKALAM